jgi:hypothetical protein
MTKRNPKSQLRNRATGKSSESSSNPQRASAEPKAEFEISNSENSLTRHVELLASLFQQFLEAEEHCTQANEKKAAIFAEAKAKGLDPSASRAAFRQRVREVNKPELGEKHDASNSLATSYLDALRGNRTTVGGCSPAEHGALHPGPSCDRPLAYPEALAHTRTREGFSDPPDYQGSEGSDLDPPATRGIPSLNDEPEIPECLRAQSTTAAVVRPLRQASSDEPIAKRAREPN